MKKHAFLLIALLSASISFAQIAKGTLLIGTTSNVLGAPGLGSPGSISLGFGTNKTTSTVAGTESESEEKFQAFNIAPTAGYFIADNFLAGITVGYFRYVSEEDKDKFSNANMVAGPILRYYLTNKSFRPYVEARGGIVNQKVVFEPDGDDKVSYSNNGSFFGGKLGGAYFLSEKASLDLFIDYSNMTIKDEEDILGVQVESKQTTSIFGFGVGFSFFL